LENFKLTSKCHSQWSSTGSNKSPSVPVEDYTPSEDVSDASDNNYFKDRSKSSRQTSHEPEKQEKEKGGELAKDIEVRRLTNERLYSSAEAYWSSFSE
jgi:hypothetical protein